MRVKDLKYQSDVKVIMEHVNDQNMAKE